MSKFELKPISQRSLINRTLKYRVGVNDAIYLTSYSENGVKHNCPIYEIWHGMLRRAYDKKYQIKQPTYIGVTVSSEWLYFMNFRKWVLTHDWQGKQLDKDLKVIGNRVYSKDMCMFIPQDLNNFFNNHENRLGDLPLGVYMDKHGGKFKVQVCNPFTKKREYLGRFSDINLASLAYKKGKNNMIEQMALKYPDHSVYILNRLYKIGGGVFLG